MVLLRLTYPVVNLPPTATRIIMVIPWWFIGTNCTVRTNYTMVVLITLSHYNSITEPRARFLLSLMEGFSIDFPSHFITSIIDVYRDIATCDKLIFPSTITRILMHFSIPIPLFPLFTIMGAISAGSIWRSEA